MGQLWTRRSLTATAVALVATLSGCTSALKPNNSFNIQDFISSVTDGSGSIHAVLVDGAAPASASGPNASVNGVSVMINGGSSQQTVTGSGAFTRVIVSVDGLNNYYELTLPSGVSTQSLVISANPSAYASNLTFAYAVADAQGVGQYARQAMRFLQVGTGDIQVSVAWDDSADVDLHVVDPNGEHIYFGHRDAASGGTLDLDANAACGRNVPPGGGDPIFVSNENVVWPTGKAIPGQYVVFLHYWSACGTPQTNWVATIQRTGAQPQIVSGSFVGSASAVDTVSVFTY
ncbi:MAG TPA: hypothetical protein VG692_12940 [Gemmatimonadales bacterium]|nr:hypothetical protein [Gemmatimonadales bacterium]